jgi:3-methylcrotonyl-CoA carboxylase alpha subunit
VRVFDSVLIANRGEIACRIMRTARRLGMRTIAVHSEADAGALFTELADETHLIGPAAPGDSYLRIERVIEVARETGAACIHPGYGFLSEHPKFAEACAANGIVFVGPPPEAIRAMGLKDAAKTLMSNAGIPVVPGYHGPRQELDFLRARAAEIGYPVLIKPVAGGGGKGMRRVEAPEAFETALASAQREAQGAFGDGRVLIEQYVLAPRHIEIQVFADTRGNIVHLFERDCSLQRRHQKVMEEAPAPGMSEAVRAAMGRAAIGAARAVGYVGAGTVEFITDAREGLRPNRFYFMEMNTRLQVEHPVTEAVTGLDLVELQFRVAAGERLPFGQEDLAVVGHAVEARVYAEDPENGFLPSTGKLWRVRLPEREGVRLDTGVREGDEITPFYDPMLAKIIAFAPTRAKAIDRLAAALRETVIAGPKTNVGFLEELCAADEFRAGRIDTGFIDRNLDALVAKRESVTRQAVAAGALHLLERDSKRKPVASAAARLSPWSQDDGFQLLGSRTIAVTLTVDGVRQEVQLAWSASGPALPSHQAGDAAPQAATIVETGDAIVVVADGRQTRIELYDPFAADLEHIGEGGVIKAPMHGKLVALFVKPGDRVEKGQPLAVVEAMKMEHVLLAPAAGDILDVTVEAGRQVAEGARLIGLRRVREA